MIELDAAQFNLAQPIFSRLDFCVPLQAILEGSAPGRVFVDRATAPTVAFVWTRWGYYYLCGNPHNATFVAALAQRLADELLPASITGGESEPILYPDGEGWKAYLETLFKGRQTFEIYRRVHAFDRAAFNRLPDWRARIPAGFDIKRIDRALLAQTGDQFDIEQTWNSVDDFGEKGIGFAVWSGDRLASVCMSAFVGADRAEIGVHTDEAYRRRGLAQLAAQAFIEACLQQGLTPNWECFWDNEPSVALAQKLGFVMQFDHPIYVVVEANHG
ncbi:MAG: GNAT family N-acetyltransferase [Anaerolineae bacterium]|nr:GNAT family N-acetyltransferase [Anaerolineae bacterium]